MPGHHQEGGRAADRGESGAAREPLLHGQEPTDPRLYVCLAGGQVDKVEVFKCFRPGDIVRARVISLGDARQYYLSTAENELGVSRGRGQLVR